MQAHTKKPEPKRPAPKIETASYRLHKPVIDHLRRYERKHKIGPNLSTTIDFLVKHAEFCDSNHK